MLIFIHVKLLWNNLYLLKRYINAFGTVLLWLGLYLPLHVFSDFAFLVTFCKQVRARPNGTANTQNQLIPHHLDKKTGFHIRSPLNFLWKLREEIDMAKERTRAWWCATKQQPRINQSANQMPCRWPVIHPAIKHNRLRPSTFP